MWLKADPEVEVGREVVAEGEAIQDLDIGVRAETGVGAEKGIGLQHDRNTGVRKRRKKSLPLLTEKIKIMLLPKRRARCGVRSGNAASLGRKIHGLPEGMWAASKRRRRGMLRVEADHLRK